MDHGIRTNSPLMGSSIQDRLVQPDNSCLRAILGLVRSSRVQTTTGDKVRARYLSHGATIRIQDNTTLTAQCLGYLARACAPSCEC